MPHRGAGMAPVFAALEGGYFREQGLEPNFLPYHGHSNSLKALIAGEADFTNAVGAELILANASTAATRSSSLPRFKERAAGIGPARHRRRGKTCAANDGASRRATMLTNARLSWPSSVGAGARQGRRDRRGRHRRRQA